MEKKYVFDNKYDLNILNTENIKKIMICTSVSLCIGAILNYISQYMIYQVELIKVLIYSSILLFLAFLIQVISRSKIKVDLKIKFFLTIIVLLIPIITFSFLEYASITVWAFPFLLLIISLVFTNRKMIFLLAGSILFTQITVWIIVPTKKVFIEGSDHVVRVGLFLIAIYLVFYINDIYIKKLKQSACQINKINELAYFDNLTGLPNRTHFYEKLNHAISLANRMKTMFAIIFLDLDGFKIINDTMGHLAGDKLLIEVSKRLVTILRKCDVVCRLGGDEFIILIENVIDINSVETVADKIIQSFNKPFSINNKDCFVSASIGVAIYPTDGIEVEILIKNADIAMYNAKEKGRNQYVFCTSEIKNRALQTMILTKELYYALERKEFELYYQPQVNCISNEIVGVEALIRWKHPKLGIVTPEQFIPNAEQTNLIISIGEWVLRTACEQNKSWQDAGLPQIRMGVNFSIKQFENPSIINGVEEVLKEVGLDHKYLEIEITENVVMKKKDYIIEIFSSLRKKGIYISIDDFGTGYSSLNYLKQLPVDRIKIPMPFIQGIDVSDKDEAVTKAIIVLAKSMGLSVIAEGVETQKQLNFLTQQMCDEVQGFYYFKPMPAHEVEELLRRQGCVKERSLATALEVPADPPIF